MNKKAFFFSIELHAAEGGTEYDFHNIPNLLIDIINNNGNVNGNIRTLDLTPENEDLHMMLDVYHYRTEYLFARASKQRPTGSVIGRDYNTKATEGLLNGYSEDIKGIELYTYLYINYESCVLQIISALGAPNENIIKQLVCRYGQQYELKLYPIPNINGVEKIYGKQNSSINSIELELVNPDPAILEHILGQNVNDIAEGVLNEHLKVSVDIRSIFSRHGITEDTENSDRIIDVIRERINNLGHERINKACIRGKTQNTKTRDYNFYDENFYFMVDIPAYRMENGRRIYYDEAELAQINFQNMTFSYNESRDYILPLTRRG